LSAYLDASVLVSIWVADSQSARVGDWLARSPKSLLVSNWAVTEFTSALGVRRRAGTLDVREREAAENALDLWLESGVERADLISGDFVVARRLMRSETSPIKAADALHIAVAQRLGCSLATLDVQQRRMAEALGLETEVFAGTR
jgi:predicted nucleic acid-binding protein